VKIYVINLDKDINRIQWMDRQLSAHKLEYSRISAVNGPEVRAQHESYWSDPRRSQLGAAEVGCLLSHAKAWRFIAQGDCEYGLVLEDDLHLADDFGEFIRTISIDSKEFCVHKLDTSRATVTVTRKPAYTARNRQANKLHTNHGSAAAYILSKVTASVLINHMQYFDAAVDIELFDPERRKIGALTIHQWIPAPCIQDCFWNQTKSQMLFGSNIGIDRADRRLYPLKRSKKYEEILKSQLRPIYRQFYSAWLFQRGLTRRRIEFA
jgi:glycosyl transferase, family 25